MSAPPCPSCGSGPVLFLNGTRCMNCEWEPHDDPSTYLGAEEKALPEARDHARTT